MAAAGKLLNLWAGKPATPLRRKRQAAKLNPVAAMPSHHPDHQQLHFSVFARTAVGLLLVAILALGVWLAIFWHYPAQNETTSPNALAAKRPAAQAALRLDLQ